MGDTHCSKPPSAGRRGLLDTQTRLYQKLKTSVFYNLQQIFTINSCYISCTTSSIEQLILDLFKTITCMSPKSSVNLIPTADYFPSLWYLTILIHYSIFFY